MPSIIPTRYLVALVLATAAVAGQAPPSDPSAAELTRLYVEHAKSNPDARRNYTFLIHAHNITYTNGKSTHDSTEDSEQIFIGGLPYIRHLARNGKPLAGKDLKHENELYDKAVQERSGLTELDRMKAAKQRTASITFLPVDHFVSDFRPEIPGHELVDGHDCLILDLNPLRPDGPKDLQLHLRLSLEAKTLQLVQYRVEVLGQVGSFGKGSVFEQRDMSQDGVWLPVFSKIDALVGVAHFVDTEDFSNYRRFRVSSTIHELPSGEPHPQ